MTDERKKRRRNDHFTKLYTVLPMGPIKKEPQHYRQDRLVYPEGDPNKLL